MDTVEVRVVDTLDPERFQELREALLVGATSFVPMREGLGEHISGVNERPHAMRVGAFDADGRLVGFSVGWQQGEGRFYMASSAVDPAFQRRGVYNALLARVISEARARGFAEVWSRHLPDNAPILIAKLKQGFVIAGVEMTASYGMLVSLALPLNEARAHALAFRMGSRRMPRSLERWFIDD